LENIRDTIFISHANPEDNQFTEWLYTQLTLAGYFCWCDLENLYGGERDFSESIQEIIEEKSCRFLLVLSKSTFLKEFVKDEFEFARGIAKKNNLTDFINPIKIDNINFDVRIGLNRYNHFIFENSWPSGLHRLLRKFEHDKIPRSDDRKSEILKNWANNNFTLYSGINRSQITYYSNWWQINSYPDKIFVFQYQNDTQAKAIIEEDTVYPKIRHGNCVVAFQQNIVTFCIKHENIEILPSQIFTLSVPDILEGYSKDDFPTFSDAQNFFKRLLKKSLKDTMFRFGLSRYKMAGKQDCFFYRADKKQAVKVSAIYPDGKTRRTLFGKYFEDSWHFGISFKVLLEPFVCFSLKSHLVFTYDGFKKWSDDSSMFSARRKKGKRMFNKEWRDLLICMLHSFKDEDGKIITVLSDDHLLELLPYTISFECDYDYIEPRNDKRLSLLIDDSEEDDVEEFLKTEILSLEDEHE
jgi:hypothetical protein